MAATRRSTRLKLLAEKIKDNGRISSRADDLPTYSDLPTELLEMILSQLNLRDNIRASAVCKNWLVVATSVREPNKPPWLMFAPKFGHLYEFYDPLKRKTYWLEFPELRDTRICYCKDGWLLLFRPRTRSVFFFSPYTRELINLPNQQLGHQIVAFSAAPTSSSCVVFTVRDITPTIVAVSTCRPGATEWTTRNHQNQQPFFSSILNKIVFCKGRFYCLSINGNLGVYDPEKRTWGISSVRPPKCMECCSVSELCRGKFMAEDNGDIFVIFTCAGVSPFIYKLDEGKETWLEIEFLGGVTVFANSLSSIARTGFHGKMRNCIYFSKVLLYGKRCVSYSPDNGRYYPRNENYDWGKQDPCESVWIDAPEDLSTLL